MFNETKLQEFIGYLRTNRSELFESWLHGISHWQRVEKFGIYLCSLIPAADMDVVRWFAYLHDSQRGLEWNYGGVQHGPLASRFIKKIRKTFLSDLTDSQIKLLMEACSYHTSAKKKADITVNVCFDSDRLDLPRCVFTLIPSRMATDEGARLARDCSYDELLSLANA